MTVVDDTPVVVDFPSDFTAFCTASSGGFTNSLDPDFTGRPFITGDDCELVGVSYEDEFVFRVSDNACFKVIRVWAVIDWCAFDEDNPSEPQTFTHTQVISVQDQVAPVLSAEDDRVVAISGVEAGTGSGGTGICESVVVVGAPTVSDCSSDVRVRAEWTFTAAASHCGANAEGAVADASGGFTSPSFAPGTLVVTFIADDGCNNVSKASVTYTIIDAQAPTPFCRDLFTVIMPSTGETTVWASDLDIGSFDNCDGCAAGDISFSFDAAGNQPSVTFTCDQLGDNLVNMYVTDASGNADFCEVVVQIQNSGSACLGTESSPLTMAAIAGVISNEEGEMVEAVRVNANGTAVTTGAAGTYNLQLNLGGDYTIAPEKNIEPLNGVSTFDLVLLRKHIVGTQPLDSPYKLIAADINNSGSITSFDMVELRKVVLQLVSEFPSNTSWRFVDANYNFSSENPLSEEFSEVYDVTNLSTDMAVNFIAVKVGDLNSNAVPNNFIGAESRSTVGTMNFNVQDRFVQAGEKVTVEFASDLATTQGYQFTLDFNGLEFNELVEGVATANNFNTTLASRGQIAASWNGQATDNVQFGLTFTATTSGQLSELMNISSEQVTAEAYTNAGELLNVGIAFDKDATATGFELFQNTPNPFDGATLIGFNLPEAGSATFKVLDIQGKVLQSVTNDYTKGFNQISLNAKDLSATGVLYYQLESADNVATKKMIIIE